MPEIDVFSWRTMTTAINAMIPPSSFVLDNVFSATEQHLADVIDVDVTVGDRKLAPFVSDYAPGTVVSKTRQEMRTIKLPRIRQKAQLDAKELLTTRSPGSGLYFENGNLEDYKRKKIAQEQQNLQDRIVRREEWLACQSLAGAVTVEQPDLKMSIDYLMPAAHKPVLVGAEQWTDASSNPIGDIRTWKRLISNATGKTADFALVGWEVVETLLKHAGTGAILNNRQIAAGAITLEGGKAGNYVGSLAGVGLYEYNEQYYNDETGQTADMIPSNAFILIARSARFTRHYGITLDLKANAQVAARFFSKMYMDEDPSAVWVLAESRPLPVPHQPEAVVSATVV